MWFCVEKAKGPKGSIKPDASVIQKAFCVQCQLTVRAVHFDQIFKVRWKPDGDPVWPQLVFRLSLCLLLLKEALQQGSPRSVQEGPLTGQDLARGLPKNCLLRKPRWVAEKQLWDLAQVVSLHFSWTKKRALEWSWYLFVNCVLKLHSYRKLMVCFKCRVPLNRML